MSETALVVLVPEAEALVGAHRLRHDPSAAVGVPAHVTVLYPFRSMVDYRVADVVGGLAADVPAFDVEFAALARFPGEVVYLAPVPATPFRRLTARVASTPRPLVTWTRRSGRDFRSTPVSPGSRCSPRTPPGAGTSPATGRSAERVMAAP